MEIKPAYRFIIITILRVASATFFVLAGVSWSLLYLLLAIILFIIAEIWDYFALPTSKCVYKVLLGIIYRIFNLPPERDLRCTLLIPSKLKQSLVPIARYGGALSGSKIPFGKGVAGQCFSTKRSIIEPVIGNFHEYMLKRGFTEKEARQFKPRESYLCVPIIRDKDDPEEPLGIISLDSSKVDTFNKERLEIVETLFVVPFYTLLKEKR